MAKILLLGQENNNTKVHDNSIFAQNMCDSSRIKLVLLLYRLN